MILHERTPRTIPRFTRGALLAGGLLLLALMPTTQSVQADESDRYDRGDMRFGDERMELRVELTLREAMRELNEGPLKTRGPACSYERLACACVARS